MNPLTTYRHGVRCLIAVCRAPRFIGQAAGRFCHQTRFGQLASPVEGQVAPARDRRPQGRFTALLLAQQLAGVAGQAVEALALRLLPATFQALTGLVEAALGASAAFAHRADGLVDLRQGVGRSPLLGLTLTRGLTPLGGLLGQLLLESMRTLQ